MNQHKVFGIIAVLSGLLMLVLGLDNAVALHQMCHTDTASSSGPLLNEFLSEPPGCFSDNVFGSFNWKLWALAEAVLAVILAIGLFIISAGLFRKKSWAKPAWLAALALLVIYFGLFWVAPGGSFLTAGLLLMAVYVCIYIAAVRLLPRNAKA